MRQSAKVEGTKIAQAAKDLNVTSVTIRRYLTEFNIETTSDENGIKVLPSAAMEELTEIRRLKEEGLTNPKVMEILEDLRSNRGKAEKAKPKAKATKAAAEPKAKAKETAKPVEEDDEDEEIEEPAKAPDKKRPVKRVSKPVKEVAKEEEVEPSAEPDEEEQVRSEEGDLAADGRSKHSLTCQTCGKVFEHMNPRLRDCLECYRAKRKERRRGGSDRHKNVIQHPIAQQVVNKTAQASGQPQPAAAAPARERIERERPERPERPERFEREPFVAQQAPLQAPLAIAQSVQRTAVRNYRKAIEETRQITGSLKRRLERPDLPEGERRWLEQIYAYQLILHQGWRHLAEYKAGTQQQKPED